MTTEFTSPAIADCPVCHGTGRDDDFNSPCNCLKMVAPSIRQRLAQAIGDVTTASPSTSRSGGGRSSANRFANRFAGKCVCGGWVEAGAGLAIRDGQGWAVKHNPGDCGATCSVCSRHVARGQGFARRDDDGNTVVRHRECPTPVRARAATGLDLSVLPRTGDATFFGVPGADTRLKVRVRAGEGKWAGWFFVDDGAAYGHGRRYGKQAPRATYSGDIEAELAAIIADPMGALRRYAELTNHCGVCNRPLEDADSVARGIGPVCARRLGLL